MNWKTDLQLRDLDADQKIELTCKICGAVQIKQAQDYQARIELTFAWLDEIERDEICKQRGCYGNVRLSIYHKSEQSGFVGGLA